MRQLLDGKVCIITGAGTGVGAASAKAFAEEGARLVLAGRTAATLENTLAEVKRVGGTAICVPTDVSRADDCRKLVDAAAAHFGRLDCALNNAAIDGPQAATADYPEAAFDEVTAINLKGVWNCMRFQIPQMRKHGQGSILNVSSATTAPTQPMMAAYVASKYGVNGLTKTAALEYARERIRINALLLGIVATPMIREIFKQLPHYEPALLKQVPCGRFATPEECGLTAAWILSDYCGYMTGSEVLYDGGYVLPQRLG